MNRKMRMAGSRILPEKNAQAARECILKYICASNATTNRQIGALHDKSWV